MGLTPPFTMQLCYKSLCILNKLTKSQKDQVSNHDGLQKLHNNNFVRQRSQGFLDREQSSRNLSFPQSNL